MVKKSKSGKRKMKKMQMNGEGFFQDVGNFFTRTIPRAAKTVYNKALKPAGQFIKDKKLLSKTLGAIGSVAPGPIGNIAKVGSVVSGAAGLGKKGKRKRMAGGGAVRF